MKKSESVSSSVVSDSLPPHGLQGPHGESKQECWSGLPFLSPGDLPNPGIKPESPALQADSLLSEPSGKPTTRIPLIHLDFPLCDVKPVTSPIDLSLLDSQRPDGVSLLPTIPLDI